VLALVGALPALSAEHTHTHAHGHGAHAHGEHGEHGDHDHAEGTDHEHDEGEEHGDDHEHADGEHHEHAEGEEHGNDHGHSGDAAHDHAEGDLAGHAHGDGSDGAHEHPHDPGAPHEHPDDPSAPHEHPDDPDDPHPHPHPDPDPDGPITSIDDPRLTPEQFAAAIALMVGTGNGMRGFQTEADLVAAGYQSIGDGGHPGEYEHFFNWSYLTDEHELDPAHIEAVVMKMNADGTTRVVSAMYMLTMGDTLASAPEIASSLTTWHDHPNQCFEGTQLIGRATGGGACASGVLVDLPPMLYVWVEANPCGPFAVIDDQGRDCGAPHEH
jgi:hypothetical protein